MRGWAVILQVELMRTTDTRASRWLVVSIAVVGVGTVALSNGEEATMADFVNGAAIPLAALLPALAVLVATSDWSTRAAMATFTSEPRRLRILVTRAVALILLVTGLSLVTSIVTAIAFVALHPDRVMLHASLSALVAGGQLYALAISTSMTGFAVGSLLLNTPAAIVVAFLVPVSLDVGAGVVAPDLAPWISTLAFSAWLGSPHLSWGDTPDGLPGIGRAMVSFLLWTAAPTAVGFWRQMKRDVR